jgi:hypothetical protein
MGAWNVMTSQLLQSAQYTVTLHHTSAGKDSLLAGKNLKILIEMHWYTITTLQCSGTYNHKHFSEQRKDDTKI